jgi:hypothetical protein
MPTAVASPPPMHRLATPRGRRLAQRADQGDEDARAGGADRVAQRAGAAVHVDLLVRQLECSCMAAMATTAKASLIS